MEDYTIPRPEPTPSPLFAAALALGKEAHRRGQEAILPAFYEPFAVHAAAEKISEESPAAGIMPQSAAPSRYLLTEGIIQGLFIHVAMPSGATWRYQHSLAECEGRVLLCFIDTLVPLLCGVFRPSSEGIHPFLGQALRFGVDRSVA